MPKTVTECEFTFDHEDLIKIYPRLKRIPNKLVVKSLVGPIYDDVIQRAKSGLHLHIFGAAKSGNFYRSNGCEFIVGGKEVSVRGGRDVLCGDYQDGGPAGGDASDYYYGVTSIKISSDERVPVEKVYNGVRFVAEKAFHDTAHLIDCTIKRHPRFSTTIIKSLL